jgi:hypothetical protein
MLNAAFTHKSRPGNDLGNLSGAVPQYNRSGTNATMSFGFGVGDFLTVIQVANKIRKDFAGAPDEFKGALDV